MLIMMFTRKKKQFKRGTCWSRLKNCAVSVQWNVTQLKTKTQKTDSHNNMDKSHEHYAEVMLPYT